MMTSAKQNKSDTGKTNAWYKLGKMNANFILLCAALLFVVACLVLAMAFRQVHSKRFPQSFAGVPASRTVTQGSVVASLDKVTRENGEGPFKAADGKTYVVVDLVLFNNSTKPINIAPATDTYLKDSKGNVVYLSAFSLERPFKSGLLLPGETVRGQLSYLVDKNASYKYYLESDWTGGVINYVL